MASLIGPDFQRIYLTSNHIFGRLASAVDTEIKNTAVSRIHFAIEYQEESWWVVDFSRNGTWVNQTKLEKNQRVRLQEADQIAIGQKQSLVFTWEDNSPPTDLLVQRESAGKPIQQSIALDAPKSVDIADQRVTLTPVDTGWRVNVDESDVILVDQDWLQIAQQQWQLLLTNQPENTAEQLLNQQSLDQLELCIHTSLDEETTHVLIDTGHNKIDLKTRSHHYLVLVLARYWVADFNSGVDRTECGWVYVDELSKMLAMAETALNIQVYRIRKQLSTALDGYFLDSEVIIRRRGQVRLGFSKFSIYKGEKLESQVLPTC